MLAYPRTVYPTIRRVLIGMVPRRLSGIIQNNKIVWYVDALLY